MNVYVYVLSATAPSWRSKDNLSVSPRLSYLDQGLIFHFWLVHEPSGVSCLLLLTSLGLLVLNMGATASMSLWVLGSKLRSPHSKNKHFTVSLTPPPPSSLLIEAGSGCVDHIALELPVVLLCLSLPKCWDYKSLPIMLCCKL